MPAAEQGRVKTAGGWGLLRVCQLALSLRRIPLNILLIRSAWSSTGCAAAVPAKPRRTAR